MTSSNTKTVLFFQPQHMLGNKPMFLIKQWIRTPEGITTVEYELNAKHLTAYLPKLNHSELRKTLLTLTPTELRFVEKDLTNKAKGLQVSTSKMMLQYCQKQFSLLKNQADVAEIHVAAQGLQKGSMQIGKCSFYKFPVEIGCRVIETNNGYQLQGSCHIGKLQIALQACVRYHFLLLHEHTIYQLSSPSMEAAILLEQYQHQIFTAEQKETLKQIVSQLKKHHIQVNDDLLFDDQTIIEAEPVLEIMLSELNNTFLKLEPRFLYSGYTVEGTFEPITKIVLDGEPILIARDQAKEAAHIQFIQNLHPKFATQRNGFFYLGFDEAQKKSWFLKVYFQLLDMGVQLTGMQFLQHFRYSNHKPTTNLQEIDTEGNWIVATLQVQFGKEKIGLQYLQKSILNGQKALMLKDASLGVLGDDWLQQYGQIVRHAKIRQEVLLIPKWLMLTQEIHNQQSPETIVASNFKQNINPDWFAKWQTWEKQDGTHLYNKPASLQIDSLRPYQQKGYEWLRLLSEIGGSACLADDMGLGKTIQTIAFLLAKTEEQPAAKHLVVAPASLVYNWQAECKKFAPSISVLIYHGADRQQEDLTNPAYSIIITSYGTMRMDIEPLAKIAWSTAVLDESHQIKNPAAQITRCAWQLTAQTRIALSGTPVMNGTEDLYSQMEFLLPGMLGSAEFFRKEYALPIQQHNNEEKAQSLKKLIAPFVLRRTKEQAAPDLPPKTESVLWCSMDVEQRLAYDTVKENVRSNLMLEIDHKGLQQATLSVLAGLTKLRQICNSAALVTDQDLFCYESVKTKMLIEELKSIIPYHKALVFSQFTSMLDLLENDLQKAGIDTLRLDGSTALHKRQELVASFQEEEGKAQVFLLSLKAGNAGLTLTKADYVFLFDPWWNTAVENQAIDRTHRIGQQQNVFAYRLICKDTIEEKIIAMAQQKKKLAEDLITVDEGFVKSLTLEDIQYLLA